VCGGGGSGFRALTFVKCKDKQRSGVQVHSLRIGIQVSTLAFTQCANLSSVSLPINQSIKLINHVINKLTSQQQQQQ
jgi:hypothetical protein